MHHGDPQNSFYVNVATFATDYNEPKLTNTAVLESNIHTIYYNVLAICKDNWENWLHKSLQCMSDFHFHQLITLSQVWRPVKTAYWPWFESMTFWAMITYIVYHISIHDDEKGGNVTSWVIVLQVIEVTSSPCSIPCVWPLLLHIIRCSGMFISH